MAEAAPIRTEYATDLERFLALTATSVSQLARDTGVERSRIARIVSGDTPDPRASAYLAIVAWAEATARRRRIPLRHRLKWRPAMAEGGGEG